MAERIPRDRRAIFADLSADEMEALLAWFVESYTDGWRPSIFARRRTDELHLKAVELMVQMKDFHRRRIEREEARDERRV